jgi:transketolase
VPAYAPWRQLTAGAGVVVVAAGPLAGTYIEPFTALPEAMRPNLWAVAELPLTHNPPPAALLKQLARSGALCVVEEHVQRGGLGGELALMALEQHWPVDQFHHLFARAHHYAAYGSQTYLRAQSGLDPASVLRAVAPALRTAV